MKLPEIDVRRPVTIIIVCAAIAFLESVAFFKLNLDRYAEVVHGLSKREKMVTSGGGRLRSDIEVNVQDTPREN